MNRRIEATPGETTEPTRLARRLSPVDVMTVAFIVGNIVFIALARNSIAEPLPLIGGYLGCLAVSCAAVAIGGPERYAPPRGGLARALRWFQGLFRRGYPLTLFLYFFVAVTSFDTALFKENLDPFFASLDERLFGFVPSWTLMIERPSLFLSELLSGAYVLYYASIGVLAIWLYAKDRPAMSEYVFVVMLLVYAACLTYIVLPVVGGRYDPTIRELTETYRYGPFTRLMSFIYRRSAHEGAAFPSTHAIVSLVVALFSIRRARPLAPLFCVNAALIFAATVYCGYHYVVDVLAALVYVAALYPAGLGLYAALRDREPGAAVSVGEPGGRLDEA